MIQAAEGLGFRALDFGEDAAVSTFQRANKRPAGRGVSLTASNVRAVVG
jgi:hypothetical protein